MYSIFLSIFEKIEDINICRLDCLECIDPAENDKTRNFFVASTHGSIYGHFMAERQVVFVSIESATYGL